MGVWGLMGLHREIKKWEELAALEGISEADRAFYLIKVDEAKSAHAAAVAEFGNWAQEAEGWYLVSNVANRQCPMCRSTDVQQKWVNTNYYFQCNACGERFKSE